MIFKRIIICVLTFPTFPFPSLPPLNISLHLRLQCRLTNYILFSWNGVWIWIHPAFLSSRMFLISSDDELLYAYQLWKRSKEKIGFCHISQEVIVYVSVRKYGNTNGFWLGRNSCKLAIFEWQACQHAWKVKLWQFLPHLDILYYFGIRRQWASWQASTCQMTC